MFSSLYTVFAQTHDVIYIVGDAETISYDADLSHHCINKVDQDLKSIISITKTSKENLKVKPKNTAEKKSLVKKEPKVLPKNRSRLNVIFKEGQSTYNFASLDLCPQIKFFSQNSQFATLVFTYKLQNKICGCLNFTPLYQLDYRKETHFSLVGRAPPIS